MLDYKYGNILFMKLKFLAYFVYIILLYSCVFAEESVYIPSSKTDIAFKKQEFKSEQNNQGYVFDTYDNPKYYDFIIYNGYFIDRTYNLIDNYHCFYMPMLRKKFGRR